LIQGVIQVKNDYRLYGVLSVFLLLAAQGAHAFNLRWLEDTPVQSFNDEDWRLLQQTVEQALNRSNKGDRLTWQNPESGNSGSVTNIGPADQDGRSCIRLGIHNETEKLSGSSVARFCRQDDGSWKMEGK
jgi:surface antigen